MRLWNAHYKIISTDCTENNWISSFEAEDINKALELAEKNIVEPMKRFPNIVHVAIIGVIAMDVHKDLEEAAFNPGDRIKFFDMRDLMRTAGYLSWKGREIFIDCHELELTIY